VWDILVQSGATDRVERTRGLVLKGATQMSERRLDIATKMSLHLCTLLAEDSPEYFIAEQQREISKPSETL
jgi:hypothetical protein